MRDGPRIAGSEERIDEAYGLGELREFEWAPNLYRSRNGPEISGPIEAKMDGI